MSEKVKERMIERGSGRRGPRLDRGKGGGEESKNPMSNSEEISSRKVPANSGLESAEENDESLPWRVGVLGEMERAANCSVGRVGRDSKTSNALSEIQGKDKKIDG